MGATICSLFNKSVYVIDKDGNIAHLIQRPSYAGNILIDHPACFVVRAKDVRRMKRDPWPVLPMEKLKPWEVYFLISEDWIASPPSQEEIKKLIRKVERSRKFGCF